ncbi:hypothetical protein WH47_03983 [Habropoda laboriosa]|uniref:Uncharacterized protein n=1 Tax=Habropoda laboriosa TaxID=597456 RepID=A0A0L7QUD2_9HYME|nr:hypothetical protein WH47_03983 [Habropoda laboriosa]
MTRSTKNGTYTQYLETPKLSIPDTPLLQGNNRKQMIAEKMKYDVRRNYPIYGEREIKNRSDNNTLARMRWCTTHVHKSEYYVEMVEDVSIRPTTCT